VAKTAKIGKKTNKIVEALGKFHFAMTAKVESPRKSYASERMTWRASTLGTDPAILTVPLISTF